MLRSGRKLTMVGLDVTHRVVLTRRDVAGWTGSGTMAGCAFASMVEHYIGSYEMNAPYLGGCALHDPLAVAVAIDPTLVGALGCNLRVDLLGEYRGRTICDEHRPIRKRARSWRSPWTPHVSSRSLRHAWLASLAKRFLCPDPD